MSSGLMVRAARSVAAIMAPPPRKRQRCATESNSFSLRPRKPNTRSTNSCLPGSGGVRRELADSPSWTMARYTTNPPNPAIHFQPKSAAYPAESTNATMTQNESETSCISLNDFARYLAFNRPSRRQHKYPTGTVANMNHQFGPIESRRLRRPLTSTSVTKISLTATELKVKTSRAASTSGDTPRMWRLDATHIRKAGRDASMARNETKDCTFAVRRKPG